LNRIKRDGITGLALLDALSKVYHLYGLDIEQPHRSRESEENDELPRIVCSEALVE